jgi:hypothetical protein
VIMIINPRDERRDVSFKRDERLAYSKVNREIFQGGQTGFERAHTHRPLVDLFGENPIFDSGLSTCEVGLSN